MREDEICWKIFYFFEVFRMVVEDGRLFYLVILSKVGLEEKHLPNLRVEVFIGELLVGGVFNFFIFLLY
jgi:hypothetical protein